MKCKNSDRKLILLQNYKTLKNQIVLKIREDKKHFYQNYFTKNNKDLRKIWQGIKQIINIKSKNFDQPSCVLIDEISITDPTEIANSFNDYFTSIAENILKKRKYNGNKSFKDYLKIPLANSFVLYPCDEKEIKTLIVQLKESKALGPNSIPTDILHLIQDEISMPLSKIFNLSFDTGSHPDRLKTSKTIPIFKKGSRLETSNYRPISLLSNVNKILEKLMFSRACLQFS